MMAGPLSTRSIISETSQQVLIPFEMFSGYVKLKTGLVVGKSIIVLLRHYGCQEASCWILVVYLSLCWMIQSIFW